MGNYIEIQDQLIRLRKKESLGVITPAKAINEAIEFCKTNNLTECELDYEGFLFDIEPTSDLKDKLSDFNRARAERTNENSGLHLQNVTNRTSPEKYVHMPEYDDYDPDYDDSDECCDYCGCYHGHHPWCGS